MAAEKRESARLVPGPRARPRLRPRLRPRPMPRPSAKGSGWRRGQRRPVVRGARGPGQVCGTE
eukprot:5967108-Lingulodinium_polyedra.AAC.1